MEYLWLSENPRPSEQHISVPSVLSVFGWCAVSEGGDPLCALECMFCRRVAHMEVFFRAEQNEV